MQGDSKRCGGVLPTQAVGLRAGQIGQTGLIVVNGREASRDKSPAPGWREAAARALPTYRISLHEARICASL